MRTAPSNASPSSAATLGASERSAAQRSGTAPGIGDAAAGGAGAAADLSAGAPAADAGGSGNPFCSALAAAQVEEGRRSAANLGNGCSAEDGVSGSGVGDRRVGDRGVADRGMADRGMADRGVGDTAATDTSGTHSPARSAPTGRSRVKQTDGGNGLAAGVPPALAALLNAAVLQGAGPSAGAGAPAGTGLGAAAVGPPAAAVGTPASGSAWAAPFDTVPVFPPMSSAATDAPGGDSSKSIRDGGSGNPRAGGVGAQSPAANASETVSGPGPVVTADGTPGLIGGPDARATAPDASAGGHGGSHDASAGGGGADPSAPSFAPLLQGQSPVGPATAPNAAAVAVATRALSMPVSDPGWPHALAAQIQWMASRQVHSATLRLSPEHLGPLEVRIDVMHAQVNVSFSAHHPDTREALAQAVPRLRELFAGSGLNLGQATVQQEARSSGQTPQDGTAGSQGADKTVEPVANTRVRRLGLIDEYA